MAISKEKPKSVKAVFLEKRIPKLSPNRKKTKGPRQKPRSKSPPLNLNFNYFMSGYERAFLLFINSCSICPDCAEKKEDCKNPRIARPSPEAMAVDVYSTVRQFGFPIHVLSEYSQEMNRYAFLLIH
jgi:predicted metal-binding protein